MLTVGLLCVVFAQTALATTATSEQTLQEIQELIKDIGSLVERNGKKTFGKKSWDKEAAVRDKLQPKLWTTLEKLRSGQEPKIEGKEVTMKHKLWDLVGALRNNKLSNLWDNDGIWKDNKISKVWEDRWILNDKQVPKIWDHGGTLKEHQVPTQWKNGATLKYSQVQDNGDIMKDNQLKRQWDKREILKDNHLSKPWNKGGKLKDNQVTKLWDNIETLKDKQLAKLWIKEGPMRDLPNVQMPHLMDKERLLVDHERTGDKIPRWKQDTNLAVRESKLRKRLEEALWKDRELGNKQEPNIKLLKSKEEAKVWDTEKLLSVLCQKQKLLWMGCYRKGAHSLDMTGMFEEGKDPKVLQTGDLLKDTISTKLWDKERLLVENQNPKLWDKEGLFEENNNPKLWDKRKLLEESQDPKLWNDGELVDESHDLKLWDKGGLFDETRHLKLWNKGERLEEGQHSKSLDKGREIKESKDSKLWEKGGKLVDNQESIGNNLETKIWDKGNKQIDRNDENQVLKSWKTIDAQFKQAKIGKDSWFNKDRSINKSHILAETQRKLRNELLALTRNLRNKASKISSVLRSWDGTSPDSAPSGEGGKMFNGLIKIPDGGQTGEMFFDGVINSNHLEHKQQQQQEIMQQQQQQQKHSRQHQQYPTQPLATEVYDKHRMDKIDEFNEGSDDRLDGINEVSNVITNEVHSPNGLATLNHPGATKKPLNIANKVILSDREDLSKENHIISGEKITFSGHKSKIFRKPYSNSSKEPPIFNDTTSDQNFFTNNQGDINSGGNPMGDQTSEKNALLDSSSGKNIPGDQTSGENVPGDPIFGESTQGDPTTGENTLGDISFGENTPGDPASQKKATENQSSMERTPGELASKIPEHISTKGNTPGDVVFELNTPADLSGKHNYPGDISRNIAEDLSLTTTNAPPFTLPVLQAQHKKRIEDKPIGDGHFMMVVMGLTAMCILAVLGVSYCLHSPAYLPSTLGPTSPGTSPTFHTAKLTFSAAETSPDSDTAMDKTVKDNVDNRQFMGSRAKIYERPTHFKSSGHRRMGRMESLITLTDDEEDGDLIYECPGLAPAGEMVVTNPFFLSGDIGHITDNNLPCPISTSGNIRHGNIIKGIN